MKNSPGVSGRALGWLAGGALTAGAVGCASGPPAYAPPPTVGLVAPAQSVAPARTANPGIAQAAHQEPATKGIPAAALPPVQPDGPPQVQVDELVQLAVGRNPRLARATFNIDAAQGRYVQAGLYPNPNLAANWDEIGDRTGPGGIVNVPRVTQEIVTGRKLSLSQAVAAREVDQATLGLLRERYALIGSVRAAFYDLYALERRIAVLDELVRVASEAVKTGQILQENKQIARLDLVQLEVELARFRSQAEAARREVPGARKRLAAVVGDPRLAVGAAAGPFDEVPAYDPDRTLDAVLATHPEVRSARVGVERAQAAVRRAEVEPIPNVTFSTGYVRQYENRSHDFQLGLSAPIPVWNRNQGNIRAAKAEVGVAVQEVGRVENDLAERVAAAFRAYSAAVKLADQYRTDILPKAEETYTLLVDCDPQGSLSQAFFGSAAVETLPARDTLAAVFDPAAVLDRPARLAVPTGFERLSIVRANQSLAPYNRPEPDREGLNQFLLRDALADMTGYDLVLIDCPPNLYLASWNAMLAAAHVVVPVPPEDFGAQGLRVVHQAIAHAGRLNPRLRLAGHLVTRSDGRLLVHRAYEQKLRALYRDTVFDAVVPEASAFKVALACRTPVSHHAPGSKAARVMAAVGEELLARTAGGGVETDGMKQASVG